MPFILRSAMADDAPGIAAVLDAASRRWVGRPTSVAAVRDRLATPGTDLALDTVVAVVDSVIVAFGHVWPAGNHEHRAFARTHPDHRGHGAGSALALALIGRARSAGSTPDRVITTTSWPHDADSDAVLRGVGYRPQRFFQKMVLDHDGPVPAAPDDERIRPYRESVDDTALFAAYRAAFAEHWGSEVVDEAGFWRDRRTEASAHYDPSLWLVASHGERIDGFALARIDEDADGVRHGYVGDVGVRPEARGTGLGEALLHGVLAELAAREVASTALDVDTENDSGALRLYRKVGMRRAPSFTIWSQPL